jgi:hypothetical protein
MQVTDQLFEVIAVVKVGDGKSQRWHIRQDSRVWPDG